MFLLSKLNLECYYVCEMSVKLKIIFSVVGYIVLKLEVVIVVCLVLLLFIFFVFVFKIVLCIGF